MQVLNSNVMKLTLNLIARSRSVARANFDHAIMKVIIHDCHFTPKMSISRRNVVHNFNEEFCHHWIY